MWIAVLVVSGFFIYFEDCCKNPINCFWGINTAIIISMLFLAGCRCIGLYFVRTIIILLILQLLGAGIGGFVVYDNREWDFSGVTCIILSLILSFRFWIHNKKETEIQNFIHKQVDSSTPLNQIQSV